MRHLTAKLAATSVFAFGASCGSWGCADNESTFYILGVGKHDGSCAYSASASPELMAMGKLDLAFDRSYEATLYLGNQMASRGQKARMRTETSRIIVEGAEITLLTPEGATFRDPFSVPGAGYVDVGSGESPGYGTLSVVLIPKPTDEQRAALTGENGLGYLIVEVKAFGKTLGGQEVESNVLRYPVEFCEGCLIDYPDDSIMNGACGSSTSTETSTVCRAGQDDRINCSECAAYVTACATPPSPV